MATTSFFQGAHHHQASGLFAMMRAAHLGSAADGPLPSPEAGSNSGPASPFSSYKAFAALASTPSPPLIKEDGNECDQGDAGPVVKSASTQKRKRTPLRALDKASSLSFRGITFSFPSMEEVVKAEPTTNMTVISRQYSSPSRQSSRAPSPSSHRDFDSDDEYFDSLSEVTKPVRSASRSTKKVRRTSSSGPRNKIPPRPRAQTGNRKQKACACCGCTSTPLWRDIGKDLPLCNACGIRWKKYGVVCDNCHYVPCKQERDSKMCKRCSVPLPPASKRARVVSPTAVLKKGR